MSDSQAYRDGWQCCLDGGDGRFLNPHAKDSPERYAWDHGFLDAMEREEDDEPCEPECAGYG